MKPITHYLRRAHLYLGLFCLPWFVMYGVTSVAFTHPDWFQLPPGLPDVTSDLYTHEGSWACPVAVLPDDGPIPRDAAAELVRVAGIDAKAFGAYRAGPNRIEVYFPSFFDVKRLVCRVDEQQLDLYTRPQIVPHALTGMHARAGYQHDSLANDAWALMVDVVMISFLAWVVTGFVIWWQFPRMRWWGALALVAGFGTFLALLVVL